MRRNQSSCLMVFMFLLLMLTLSGCQNEKSTSPPWTLDEAERPISVSDIPQIAAWDDGETASIQQKLDDTTIANWVIGPDAVSIIIAHIEDGTAERIFIPYGGEMERDTVEMDWSHRYILPDEGA